MGVRGLTSFLKQRQSQAASQVNLTVLAQLQQQSGLPLSANPGGDINAAANAQAPLTLICDADAVLFWLMRGEPQDLPDRVLGGDTALLDVALERFCNHFSRAGIDLLFFGDPSRGSEQSQRKWETWRERASADAEEAEVVRNVCSQPDRAVRNALVRQELMVDPAALGVGVPSAEANAAESGQDVSTGGDEGLLQSMKDEGPMQSREDAGHIPVPNLPTVPQSVKLGNHRLLPVLSGLQAHHTLRRIGVMSFICLEEADPALVRELASRNAFAILSQDSDFFLMEGSRYIPLDSLRFSENGEIHGWLHTCESVARALRIKADQLADFAGLAGNDVTSWFLEKYSIPSRLSLSITRRDGSSGVALGKVLGLLRKRRRTAMSEIAEIATLMAKVPEVATAVRDHYAFYQPTRCAGPARDLLGMDVYFRRTPRCALAIVKEGCHWTHRDQAHHKRLWTHIYSFLGRSAPVEERCFRDGRFQVAAVHPARGLPEREELLAMPPESRWDALRRACGQHDLDPSCPADGALPTASAGGGAHLEMFGPAPPILLRYLVATALHEVRLSRADVLAVVSTVSATLFQAVGEWDHARFPGTADMPRLECLQLSRLTTSTLRPFFIACHALNLVSECPEPRQLWSSRVFNRMYTLAYRDGSAGVLSLLPGNDAKVWAVAACKFAMQGLAGLVSPLKQRVPAPLSAACQDAARDTLREGSGAQQHALDCTVSTQRSLGRRPDSPSATSPPGGKTAGKQAPDDEAMAALTRRLKEFSGVTPILVSPGKAVSTPAAGSLDGYDDWSATIPAGTEAWYADLEEDASMESERYHQPSQREDDAQSLPILAYRQLILDGIRDHRLVCIQGETGCGKSSMVPQFLLDDAMAGEGGARRTSILVTQPRRIAAIALAKRVAQARGERVGGVAGFKISGHSEMSKRTKICFVTTGFFLQQLTHQPEALKRHSHICLDEVHERDLDTDLLCLVLKLLMADGDDNGPRLIIMSATLQAAVFLEYFTLAGASASTPPLLHVGAHRYEVKEMYLDDLAKSFRGVSGIGPLVAHGMALFRTLRARCHKASRADGPVLPASVDEGVADLFLGIIEHIALPGSCVLVFLPGLGDITDMLERLELTAFATPVAFHLLHSSLERCDQEAALEPAPPSHAKIVLATNIAESSLTIPDVTHVVDFGMQRGVWYDEMRRMSVLRTHWTCRASAIQRAGRAGRVCPGSVIRLYSKAFFDDPRCMPEHETPEVMRLSLDRVVLTTKLQLSKFGPVSQLLASGIDPPSEARVALAWEDLHRIGAISEPNEHGTPTLLGEMGVRLPTDLRGSRLIMFGLLHGCACDAVVVAAALSAQDPFSMPFSPLMKGDGEYTASLRRSLAGRVRSDAGRFSEPLSLLALFRDWLQSCGHGNTGKTQRWARKHQLNYARWRRFVSVVSDIARKVADNWTHAVHQPRHLRLLAGLADQGSDEPTHIFCDDERLVQYVLCAGLATFVVAASPDALDVKRGDRATGTFSPVQVTAPKFVKDPAVLQEALEASHLLVDKVVRGDSAFEVHLSVTEPRSKAPSSREGSRATARKDKAGKGTRQKNRNRRGTGQDGQDGGPPSADAPEAAESDCTVVGAGLPSYFETMFLHYLRGGRPNLTVTNPYFSEPIPGMDASQMPSHTRKPDFQVHIAKGQCALSPWRMIDGSGLLPVVLSWRSPPSLFSAVSRLADSGGAVDRALPHQHVAVVYSLMEASKNIRAQGSSVLPHTEMFDLVALLCFQRFGTDGPGAVVQFVGSLAEGSGAQVMWHRINFEGGCYELAKGYFLEEDLVTVNRCRQAVSAMLQPDLGPADDVVEANMAAYSRCHLLCGQLGQRTRSGKGNGKQVVATVQFAEVTSGAYLAPFPPLRYNA